MSGISAVALPGHTPGHTGWLIASGKESLLVWGDLVRLASVQVARPDIGLVFDVLESAAGLRNAPVHVRPRGGRQAHGRRRAHGFSGFRHDRTQRRGVRLRGGRVRLASRRIGSAAHWISDSSCPALCRASTSCFSWPRQRRGWPRTSPAMTRGYCVRVGKIARPVPTPQECRKRFCPPYVHLLDHLVGAAKQWKRDGKAEGLGSLEVDDRSTLLDCWTGRSAGFSSLSILPA